MSAILQPLRKDTPDLKLEYFRKVREERGTHDSDVGGEARKAGPPAPHGIYSNLVPLLALGSVEAFYLSGKGNSRIDVYVM